LLQSSKGNGVDWDLGYTSPLHGITDLASCSWSKVIGAYHKTVEFVVSSSAIFDVVDVPHPRSATKNEESSPTSEDNAFMRSQMALSTISFEFSFKISW
jgi:hypothetical protein